MHPQRSLVLFAVVAACSSPDGDASATHASAGEAGTTSASSGGASAATDEAPTSEGSGGSATGSGGADTSAGGSSGSTSGSTSSDPTGDPARCQADPGPFPTPDWAEADPAAHGFDPDLLEAAADYAAANESLCLVVIRHGAIVGEWYFGDTTPDTKVKSWSVGKSYASTAVGLAVDRGEIASIDQPAADYIPEWQGTDKEAVSIRNLLQMASGLEFGLVKDNIGIFLAEDMTKLALENPLAQAPLSAWEYNNHGVQVLEPVIRGATGMDAEAYSQQHLWEPIGMDAEWRKDAVGHPAMYMNVMASCRDHARFGYLFLHEGCWEGEEMLSEGWVHDATHSSQDLNRGYGYLWWLSGEEPTLDSVDFKPKPGGLHPFAPGDAYCAVGLGNQVIEVIPSLDMVMVRFGVAPQDDPQNWLTPLMLLEKVLEDGKQVVHNKVLERVLAALVDP